MWLLDQSSTFIHFRWKSHFRRVHLRFASCLCCYPPFLAITIFSALVKRYVLTTCALWSIAHRLILSIGRDNTNIWFSQKLPKRSTWFPIWFSSDHDHIWVDDTPQFLDETFPKFSLPSRNEISINDVYIMDTFIWNYSVIWEKNTFLCNWWLTVSRNNIIYSTVTVSTRATFHPREYLVYSIFIVVFLWTW